MQATQIDSVVGAFADDARECPDDKIDALEFLPTGGSLTRKDLMILCLSGVVAPALLLIWGWA